MNLASLFSEFTTSAFRLEALPVYRVDEEVDAIKYFQEHGAVPPETNADWAALIAAARDAGKSFKRLRLFGEELSDYERFEVAVYPAGIEAGEEIRVGLRPDPVPADFWLFDGLWFAEMHYGPDGSFEGSAVRRATASDLKIANEWLAVHADSPLLGETDYLN
jgi:hypothetical protein